MRNEDKEAKARRIARRREAVQNRDPRNLLRIGGSAMPIHISKASNSNSNIAAANNTNSISDSGISINNTKFDASDELITWRGDGLTRIDRFDVRNSLDFLAATDIGANISLDPSDETPQLLEIIPDEIGEQEQELNFERYRDLVDINLCGRDEDSVIKYVDNAWLSASSFSDSLVFKNKNEHAKKSTETLEQLLNGLTADQDVIEIVEEMNESHITEMNTIGRQFLIGEVHSLYENEIKSLRDNDKIGSNKRDRELRRSRRSNRRTRNLAPFGHDRKKKQSRFSSESGSSSSESENRSESEKFVIEYESEEEAPATATSQSTTAASIAEQFKPPLIRRPISATYKNIISSELEPLRRDPNPAFFEANKRDEMTRSNFEIPCEISSQLPFSQPPQAPSHPLIASIGSKIPAKTEPQTTKPLTASEKLKMKMKLALNKQIVKDEAEVLFKKRKSNPVKSTPNASAVNRTIKPNRSPSPEVDSFGRVRRKPDS
ncbi:hypothetical protein HK100_002942 [Physocladia obscura]|uniref:Suppressor of white apricot N-terminal domain-containing protein n=1 Tax=Physocladia obscura TaxID=109957 RepID=A0AAD5T815_9FUNG|nr:hypothetical protein HK100_002942 [Physocladia obscura]